MIPIKGCPPKPESICKALHQAGINVDPSIFEDMDKVKGKYMKKYEGKPEFEETFFRIS
jgi:coenzyme F420-reducing hydrogenase gamma subunit